MAKKSRKSFAIEGDKELIEKLEALKVTGEDLSKVLDGSADIIVSELKKYAPVDKDNNGIHGRDTIEQTRRTGNKYEGFSAEKFGTWTRIKAFDSWRGIWFQNWDGGLYQDWFKAAWTRIYKKVNEKVIDDLKKLYAQKIRKK